MAVIELDVTYPSVIKSKGAFTPLIADNVVAALYPPLLLKARRLGVNDPEDLVQETLIRLWQHPPRETAHPVLLAYAEKCMEHIAIDDHRAEERSVPTVHYVEDFTAERDRCQVCGSYESRCECCG